MLIVVAAPVSIAQEPWIFADSSTSAAIVTVQPSEEESISYRLEMTIPMDVGASHAASIWIYDAAGHFWESGVAWTDPDRNEVYVRGALDLRVPLAPPPDNWATVYADWTNEISAPGNVTFAFVSTVHNASFRLTLYEPHGAAAGWSGSPETTFLAPRDWTLRRSPAVGGAAVGAGSFGATVQAASVLHAHAWGGGDVGVASVEQPDGCTRARLVAGSGQPTTATLSRCEDAETYFTDVGSSETIVSAMDGEWSFARDRVQDGGGDGPWLFAADLPCMHRPICGS